LASRGGGGWNEQARQAEILESKAPETKFGLPDLDRSKSAVLDSLRSPESKRGNRRDRVNSFSGTAASLALGGELDQIQSFSATFPRRQQNVVSAASGGFAKP
jgi:hypothetical protein